MCKVIIWVLKILICWLLVYLGIPGPHQIGKTTLRPWQTKGTGILFWRAQGSPHYFRWGAKKPRNFRNPPWSNWSAPTPASTLRHLWTMLAHIQGGLLNLSRLAGGLGASVPAVGRYIDLLEDLFLVRKLQPWTSNVGKRLVRAPKVYIRDSGLTHTLLKIKDYDDLLGHPAVWSQ